MDDNLSEYNTTADNSTEDDIIITSETNSTDCDSNERSEI